MSKLRIGIVGMGGMGTGHAGNITGAKARDFKLTAVCDIDPAKAEKAGDTFHVPQFLDARKLYDSGLCDAVIIATPHYAHGPQVLLAARAGLHVLCEKPLESRVGVARAMVAECKKRRRVLGVVLQHRTRDIAIKARQVVQSGQIGEVFHTRLICSNWFRTQAYYNRGEWRGTWDGEGGGVLINQMPHHLDLFQWIGGMPKRLVAMLATRDHDIEVEDTANMLLDYGRGKNGYIYASTAHEPGSEQIMFCGEKGTLTVAGDKLRLGKLKLSVHDHIHAGTSADAVADASGGKQAASWSNVDYPARKGKVGHLEIVHGFVRQVQKGKGLYATGADALGELELSNAAYVSGFGGKWVDLPVDADAIDRLIRKLERERSTGRGGALRKAADRDLRKLLK
jgi:predicted dehydrogenase